jgi:hypothetical protein
LRASIFCIPTCGLRVLAMFACSIWLAQGATADPKRGVSVTRTEEARRAAYGGAQVFQNEGFRIRDAMWNGQVQAGKPLLLQVTLLAGNAYWFIAGPGSPSTVLKLELFDADGRLVQTMTRGGDRTNGGSSVALGLANATSGASYVRISTTQEAAAAVCFLYCFK